MTHAPAHAARGSPRPTTPCRLPLPRRQAGFFKGLQASLLGLSHIMIQFPLYEWMKAELAARKKKFRR